MTTNFQITEKQMAPVRPNRVTAIWRNLGPGLVFALTVIGAGDIVTNAAVGSEYEYSLLGVLGVTLLFRFVWVSTSAKYVLVSGETLLEGYHRLGAPISWFLLGVVFLARHASNMYKIVLFGSVMTVFLPLPFEWGEITWSILLTLLGFWMILSGGYPFLEKVFKILMVLLGLTVVAGALLSRPDLPRMFGGLFLLNEMNSESGLDVAFLIMALIGTEAGSMTNLTYAYFIRERGWRNVSDLRKQRIDLGFSVVAMLLLGLCLQVTAAATFNDPTLTLETTDDLVSILTRTQGVIGYLVFGFGMLAAVFTGFIGGTAGYGLIASDLVRLLRGEKEPSRSRENRKKDRVFTIFVAFASFSPLYILWLEVRPIWLLLTVSAAMVLIIPFLAGCLLILTNRREQMGEHRNGLFTNLVLVTLIAASIYLSVDRILAYIS